LGVVLSPHDIFLKDKEF